MKLTKKKKRELQSALHNSFVETLEAAGHGRLLDVAPDDWSFEEKLFWDAVQGYRDTLERAVLNVFN